MKRSTLLRLEAIVFALFFLWISPTPVRGQSIPFAVSFWYPTNGQSYMAPATVGVHARVTDSNIVRKVQYFNGATSIGIVTNSSGILLTNSTQDSPFYLGWSNVAVGSYVLTAVATDSAGQSLTSAPVNITVTNQVLRPTTYIYSPTNGSKFSPPANLTLYARAVESGGGVAGVRFLANGANLGFVSITNQAIFTNVATEPLFPLAWSNVAAGNYALTAIALDTNGNTATSSVVNITVTNVPGPVIPFTVGFYYPTNGQRYSAPATVGVHAVVTDSNVVRQVQYRANGSLIGVATNTSGVLLTNSTQANPFFLTWSNVTAGSYALTAIAIDSAGNTATSPVVNITVTNVPAPVVPFTVGFYYPTNGQMYSAPATVGVHATVTDSNVVRQVQYLANGSLIGAATNTSGVLLTNSTQANPFFLTWSNVTAGSYALTAIAIDSAGNTATSPVVNITVTNVPAPVIQFNVGFYYPTNGQMYSAPATVGVHAVVTDSNVVRQVQYLANGSLIGMATNASGVLLTNSTQENPFFLTWSNVRAGSYALTAIAIDSAGNTATSPVVNITVTNVPGPVIPFTVGFYYPTNGQMYSAPATVGVHATVTDSNVVRQVQYLANGSLIGMATNASGVLLTNSTQENPFFLTWSNVTAGSYALTAIAIDSAGNTATSPVVNITVTNVPGPVIPFTVGFYYPTNGQMYSAPATVGVHATVTDSNVVRQVQYLANGSVIGMATNASGVLLTNSTQGNPFFLLWSNVTAGSYALIAVAIDSAGNTATSPVVNITVTNVPAPVIPFTVGFYYPTNGQVYSAPATVGMHAVVTDSNVVRQVQYLANGSVIGMATNASGVLLTNSTQENPFFLAWSNVTAGSYALTAVAIDSAGNAATSAPVNITVTNVPAPVIPFTVGFYYPTNGQIFSAPATVDVHAVVTDSNVVRQVQYLANGSLIGVATNASGVLLTNSTQENPFFLAWSNVTAGSYALTAVAIDSAGNAATSAPVNITVTNAPGPVIPFTVGFYYPTNGQIFSAPATVGVHAAVTDSNVVRQVQYLANGSLIGVATNASGVLLTNSTQENPFFLAWSNVTAGSYALTAIAIDSAGNTATSPVVNITVTNVPGPVIPFTVGFYYPITGQMYEAPATVGMHAVVTDSNVVRQVQYLANGSLIGMATNASGVLLTNSTQANPFFLAWSNVTAGSYALTAVAIDSAGNAATSAPVTITVTNLPRAVVAITNLMAGARLTNVTFTLKGTAADKWAVSNVWISVNGGLWTPAVGTTDWALTITLAPGTNTIQAFAQDVLGSCSPTNGVKVDCVVTAQLLLSINGMGVLSPNYSNAWLEVGRNYAITATSSAGFVFTNWTGSIVTNGRTVYFMMASNLALTANFVEVTRPAITITSPSAGQRVGNLITVKGTASDKWLVTNVWCTVGGATNIWTADTTNRYKIWNVTNLTLSAGIYMIRVYAINQAGLIGSNDVRVIVTNTANVKAARAKTSGIWSQPALIAPRLSPSGMVFTLQIAGPAVGHIESSPDLVNWQTVTNFAGTNVTLDFTNPMPANGPARFYRAVVPQN